MYTSLKLQSIQKNQDTTFDIFKNGEAKHEYYVQNYIQFIKEMTCYKQVYNLGKG